MEATLHPRMQNDVMHERWTFTQTPTARQPGIMTAVPVKLVKHCTLGP